MHSVRVNIGGTYKIWHTSIGALSDILIEHERKVYDDNEVVYVDEAKFAHNVGAPALILFDDGLASTGKKRTIYIGWFNHGKLHRVDGPAVTHIIAGVTKHSYYVNNKQYTRQEFEQLFKGVDIDQREDLAGMMDVFD